MLLWRCPECQHWVVAQQLVLSVAAALWWCSGCSTAAPGQWHWHLASKPIARPQPPHAFIAGCWQWPPKAAAPPTVVATKSACSGQAVFGQQLLHSSRVENTDQAEPAWRSAQHLRHLSRHDDLMFQVLPNDSLLQAGRAWYAIVASAGLGRSRPGTTCLQQCTLTTFHIARIQKPCHLRLIAPCLIPQHLLAVAKKIPCMQEKLPPRPHRC